MRAESQVSVGKEKIVRRAGTRIMRSSPYTPPPPLQTRTHLESLSTHRFLAYPPRFSATNPRLGPLKRHNVERRRGRPGPRTQADGGRGRGPPLLFSSRDQTEQFSPFGATFWSLQTRGPIRGILRTRAGDSSATPRPV